MVTLTLFDVKEQPLPKLKPYAKLLIVPNHSETIFNVFWDEKSKLLISDISQTEFRLNSVELWSPIYTQTVEDIMAVLLPLPKPATAKQLKAKQAEDDKIKAIIEDVRILTENKAVIEHEIALREKKIENRILKLNKPAKDWLLIYLDKKCSSFRNIFYQGEAAQHIVFVDFKEDAKISFKDYENYFADNQ